MSTPNPQQVRNSGRVKEDAKFHFRYNPLNAGHIRVLHLLAGEKHQDIQYRLEDLVLDPETAEFSALSYTWGDGTQEHHMIYIQENVEKGCHTDMRPVTTAMQVRHNLYCALTALRLPDKVRKLWIDAICIDQGDSDEKSAQVPFMRQIYSWASEVLIWLGPAADDSDFVMDCLCTGNELTTLRFHSAFIDFLMRPWFRRAWIIQELVLSRKEPLIHCGNAKPCSWERFSSVCDRKGNL
jgi:hypothetical protein